MDEKLARIRDQMPSVNRFPYLNTGTSGPLPLPVKQAMTDMLDKQTSEGRIDTDYWASMTALKGEVRQGVAGLLGCSATDVALTQNTTEGMNLVTMGVNWQPGDEVITTNLEHAGALLPCYAARDRFGITVKIADVADAPERTAELIGRLITHRTKLISISHVSFLSGAVLPIQDLCEVAHRHGVLVLVDGAQSFAAMPLNMQQLGADFYAVPGQKWLCGPEGTGALYGAPGAMAQVRVTLASYGTVDKYSTYGGFIAKESAHRFEQGTSNPLQLAGQLAACRWLSEGVGTDWAYSRIRDLAAMAREALRRVPGVAVLTPAETAGLVSFTVEGKSQDQVLAALQPQGFALRTVPLRNALRLSTGYYNTEDELERSVAAIAAIARG